MGILHTIAAQEEYYERRIAALEEDVEYWKNRWWESVDSSIRHGNDMFGLILKAALEGAYKPASDDAVDPVGASHPTQPPRDK